LGGAPGGDRRLLLQRPGGGRRASGRAPARPGRSGRGGAGRLRRAHPRRAARPAAHHGLSGQAPDGRTGRRPGTTAAERRAARAGRAADRTAGPRLGLARRPAAYGDRMKIVVLDDYQRVARTCGPFDSLPDAEAEVLHEHIADLDELAWALRGAEVVVAMRERTPSRAELFAKAPDLRLLVTTGMANASIDLAAAGAHGVTVCGTDSGAATNTAELTWALILAC